MTPDNLAYVLAGLSVGYSIASIISAVEFRRAVREWKRDREQIIEEWKASNAKWSAHCDAIVWQAAMAQRQTTKEVPRA